MDESEPLATHPIPMVDDKPAHLEVLFETLTAGKVSSRSVVGINVLSYQALIFEYSDGTSHNFPFPHSIDEIGSLSIFSSLQRFNMKRNFLRKIGNIGDIPSLQSLDLSNDYISEINGLEGLPSLQELNLSHNYIDRISGLEALFNLENLDLSDNKLRVIRGLDHLAELQNLNLGGNYIGEIGNLGNNTHLKELSLHWNNIDEIKGLDNLRELRSLVLSNNYIPEIGGLDNLHELSNLVLAANDISTISNLDHLYGLSSLVLAANHISEISGLDNLHELRSLVLAANEIFTIEGLDSLSSLQELNLSNNHIPLIGGMDNLLELQKLNLGGNQISVIAGLDSLSSLQELYLWGNQISEITGLENLVALKELYLQNNPLGTECLETLLHYKRAGQLHQLNKVNLKSTEINWFDPKAGQAAWELTHQYGVEIIADEIKYAPPKRSDLIDKFISKIDPEGELKNEERDFLVAELQKRYDIIKQDLGGLVVSDKGYTSTKGFLFKDRFIKLDIISRLRHEHFVYSLDLGDFDSWRPGVATEEFVASESENMAILAMDNLEAYTSGFDKLVANYGSLLLKQTTFFGSRQEEQNLHYNLFLMGLFHKEALIHHGKFSPVIYEGVHGRPHWEECSLPFSNSSDPGLCMFRQTEIPAAAVAPVVSHYLGMRNKSPVAVIHGDWKDDNLVNGHLIDYAMVGTGLEVDELAYYLSDAKFSFGLTQFHHCINTYISFRSSHDLIFRNQVQQGYGEQMHQLADSAFLTQLVLRHSVMNKRDLTNPAKLQQRQYYQHRINEVLREGRFV